MKNSHSFYQVGCKLDTSETFHGFVRDVKVFKGLLSNSEIQQEAGTVNTIFALFGRFIYRRLFLFDPPGA